MNTIYNFFHKHGIFLKDLLKKKKEIIRDKPPLDNNFIITIGVTFLLTKVTYRRNDLFELLVQQADDTGSEATGRQGS